MKFSAQQLKAIKDSPKGKLPNFIANTIKSKEPNYAIRNSRGGYTVKPLSKFSSTKRAYASVFGDKLAR